MEHLDAACTSIRDFLAMLKQSRSTIKGLCKGVRLQSWCSNVPGPPCSCRCRITEPNIAPGRAGAELFSPLRSQWPPFKKWRGGMRKIRTISDFICTRSVLYLRVHRTKSVLYRRVHPAYIARTSRVHRTKSVLYRRVHPYYIGFPGFLETTIQLQHQCTLPESCANLVTDMHTGLC